MSEKDSGNTFRTNEPDPSVVAPNMELVMHGADESAMGKTMAIVVTAIFVGLIGWLIVKHVFSEYIDAPIVQQSWSSGEIIRVISATGDTLATGEEAAELTKKIGSRRKVWVQ